MGTVTITTAHKMGTVTTTTPNKMGTCVSQFSVSVIYCGGTKPQAQNVRHEADTSGMKQTVSGMKQTVYGMNHSF